MAGCLQMAPLPPGIAGGVITSLLVVLAGAGVAWGMSRRPPPPSRSDSDAGHARPLSHLVEIAARTTNAIAITDVEQRIEWINPAFEQHYGFRLDDLRGRHLHELFAGHDDDVGTIARIGTAVAQGRSVNGELAYRHRDARDVLTRVEIAPLREDGGDIDGYIAVHEDLTAQRRVERELQMADTRFRLLAEAAPSMAWVEDEHGACEWFSDQWASFVGRETRLDRGDGWLDHVHPDDREPTRRLASEALAARGPFEARYRLRRHDGVYCDVLDRGVPRWDGAGTFRGYVGAVTDISQIAAQQREIADMRDALVEVIESIDGGVVILDAQDRIVLCNRRYQQMFDLPDSMVEPGTSYRLQLLEFYRAHPEFRDGRSAEDVLAERLRLHRNAPQWERRFGECWIDVRDRVTATGGLVGLRNDVTVARHAEAALQQQRRLLQDTIDSIDGGLVMFDADDRLIFANQRYREIYGLDDADSLPGMYIYDVTRRYYARHPEHLDGLTVEQRIEQRRARHRGPESTWEMQLGERWFQVNDRVLDDGSVLSLRTDITTLKETTAALEERRELLEIVVHASHDGLWDWHVQTGVLYTSPRLKELLGYRDDEIGCDWTQWHTFVHADDVAAFDDAFGHIAAGAHELEIEYRMRTKHGAWRWYRSRAMAIRDAAGATRRVAGSTSDITEQKLREQESTRARQLLDEAIDVVDAGIVRFDADERLVFCNRRYREMYGVPPALAVPGTPFRDVLRDFFTRNPECRESLDVDAIVAQRLAQQRQARSGWEQHLGERWLLVSDRPTADGGIVSLRTDITPLKRIEADLSLAKARAETANIAKSQFLANVSHELRTPLNGIIGMLQMLDDPAVPAPYDDYVRLAVRSGRALLDLINDLLDGAKIEAGRLQIERVAFAPAEVIADAVAAVDAAARDKGLVLNVVHADSCARRVIGDPARLRQVLTNLLGNAVKFTHHGSVTLQVACDAPGYLGFDVTDTGIGIPPAMQASIFEPFTQAEDSTSRRFGGTGLGLSICRHLVRLMGGDLALESTPGQGSRFRFTLPLPATETSLAVCTTAPSILTPRVEDGPRPHVLVVDDVGVNLQVVAALLCRLGVDVTTAESGRAALAHTARGSFDLVFMDCQMPELDGFATTQALRTLLGAHCPPIVAMTANVGADDRRRAADAGMCDYVTKPVELATLATMLQRHVVPPTVEISGDSTTRLRCDRGRLNTRRAMPGS